MAHRDRRGRHPVPDPELEQGPGGACDARPGRPRSVQAGDPRRLENQPNLTLFQQAVDDLTLDGDGARRVTGVITQLGIRFEADAVVLTTGTFLSGLIHVGLRHYEAGRAGDPPAKTLGARLRELKLPVGRLKTGTPPRLDGRTIDFASLDRPARRRSRAGVLASWATRAMHPRQLPCWITHTNERTHEIIRGGLDRSPMFTGVIEGVGRATARRSRTRSMRFAERASHQIFLEPEGLDDATRSTRTAFRPVLPFDVQLALVRSMQGLRARAHPAPRLRDRVRLFRSARAASRRSKPRRSAACFSPDRSTARPATRKPLRKGLLAGINAARLRARRGRLVPAPRRGVPRRAGRRSGHARRHRAVPDVHRRAPSTGCSCARTTPICVSPKPGARSASSTMRVGTRSAASATRSRASWNA